MMRFVIAFLLLPCAVFAEPKVGGLFHSSADDALQARVLLEELHCSACHTGKVASREAPRLARVGRRVNPYYLEQFIAAPHHVKPGTLMPDLMQQLPKVERAQAAEAITHFLVSLDDQAAKFQPTAPDSVAAAAGQQLFHEVGCVACHAPRDEAGREQLVETSIPLGVLEQKYTFKSLVDFLRRPHEARPAGRMPQLPIPQQDLERIAHYLLQKTQVPGHLRYTRWRGRVWEGLDADEVVADRAGLVKDFEWDSLSGNQHNTAVRYEGFIKADTAGEFRFFAEMNGGTLRVGDSEVISETASNRRHVKKMQGSVHIPETWTPIFFEYYHTGRDPRLKLEMEGPGLPKGVVPSDMLSISATEIPRYVPWQVDPDRVEEGKRWFGDLGCANCHRDVGVEKQVHPSLSELNVQAGCLSEAAGDWPNYQLNQAQRKQLQAVLPKLATWSLSEQEQLDQTLLSLNCIACHSRTGVGGIATNRDIYFTTEKAELGNQGRRPPPLTSVGAKLTPSWMDAVLLKGERQRDYLKVKMPQYAPARIEHLPGLFAKLDQLEQVEFSPGDDLKAAGHKLMGTTGLSCIACHDFNGQKAAGPGALDLVHSTARLQKNWFHLYMRNPSRFHPQVIMPSYWPGGTAVRKDVLDGDSGKQIEALWQYLSDGQRAKNPVGLSRQSSELRVTDIAVICRGRGPAGYRGLAVGYPSGLNLAFDCEQMSVRMLWKNEFARTNPGSWSPLGSDRINFEPGIPFHELKSEDDHWPYKGKTDYLFPFDHGYQFRGYTLDKQKRPNFLYYYQGVRVEEFWEDRVDEEGKAFFCRTMKFTPAPEGPDRLNLRAATGKKIEARSKSVFLCDSLTVNVLDGNAARVRKGEPDELIVVVDLPDGGNELVMEYRW